jgi:hypothetical protein
VTVITTISGADDLLGEGVYHGMPAAVPSPARDAHAVVVGEPAECAAASKQLADAGWTVTIVTRGRCGSAGIRRHCRRRTRTEAVCATGIGHLEALVQRRIDTGRIEACSASALFIL